MTIDIRREIFANRSSFAYLGVFSVQLVFAGYQILTKIALQNGIDPVGFAFIRVIGTALVCYLTAAFTGPSEQIIPRWEHRKNFALLGFSMTCNIVGLILALECTSSAVVAILQVLRPVVAALVSRFLGIERFTCQNLVGMFICMVGACFITLAGSPLSREGFGDSPLRGFLFVCIHATGQACCVIQQPFLLDAGYSPAAINAHAFLITTGLVAALVPMPFHSGVWYHPSIWFSLSFAYTVILVGSYSYAVMGWAAKRIGGTAVMLFMLLQAVLTVIAGNLVLGETFSGYQAVGGVWIVGGILVFLTGHRPSDSREVLPILKA